MMPYNVDVSSIAKSISEEITPRYRESIHRMYEAAANDDGKLSKNDQLTAEIEALRMYLEAFTVSLVQKTVTKLADQIDDALSVRE